MPTSLDSLMRHRTAHAGGDESRRVWLFHAHLYFDHESAGGVEEARALRDRIERTFGATTKHVEVHSFIAAAIGPHPRGSFEVLFTREALADVLAWLMFHRPESMSILVHPLTRAQRADHTTRAVWLGPPLALLTDILDRSDAKNEGRTEESIIEGTKRH